jgi:hypothetical protein
MAIQPALHWDKKSLQRKSWGVPGEAARGRVPGEAGFRAKRGSRRSRSLEQSSEANRVKQTEAAFNN